MLKRLTLRVSVAEAAVASLERCLSTRMDWHARLVREKDELEKEFDRFKREVDNIELVNPREYETLVERVQELEEADPAADLANDADFLRDLTQSVTEDLEVDDLVRDALSDILSNATKPHR